VLTVQISLASDLELVNDVYNRRRYAEVLEAQYQHHIPSENIPFVSTNLSSSDVVEGIKLDSLTTTCFTAATGGVLKALHIKGSLSCTSIIHHPKHQPG